MLLAVSVPLFLFDWSPGEPARVGIREAQAIIGMPLTPMSYAGVARRTTRRVVYAETAVTTAAVTTAAATQAAATQAAAAQAAAAQSAARAAPAPAAGAPAIGTVVQALPGGCAPTNKGGVEYYVCGGVWYRAAFQGSNLVYVVQAP
jgi:hypothetical protein